MEVEGEHQDASTKTIEEMQIKINKLQLENKRMREEFNSQRAKMKELFLQKEDELVKKSRENQDLNECNLELRKELDEAKSRVIIEGLTLENNFEREKRKANEEIASLQQLIHETIEESSSTRTLYDSELKKLQTYIQQLQNEIISLKNQKQQILQHSNQEQSSLAPSVVLNALTKGIVKKLGADAFSNSDEDNARKIDHDEDPELLRSLIVPLEDQIKALKEKLRWTDEQLQKCKQCSHLSPVPDTAQAKNSETESNLSTTSTNTSFDLSKQINNCDMCCNYEAQLVKEQKLTNDLELKVGVAEKAAERHKEDLLKEIGFRKEMEEKWNEKKEEHKVQVAELRRATECAEQDLKELRQLFSQNCSETRQILSRLTQDREKIHDELIALQRENDNLVGKYTIHSQELQSETIDLPGDVEELHELILRKNQDLIIAKIGKEAAEERVNSLQSDIMLLKDQIAIDQNEKISLENNLVQEIDVLKRQVDQLEREKKCYLINQEKLENSERARLAKIKELEDEVKELNINKKRLEDKINELKVQVSSLQQELDSNEAVQKDFVLLSQNLQIQLEKIRESDTQVRWQHEEDVVQCPKCQEHFSSSRKKEHCKHCGQIFCNFCLAQTVESGASMLPSKVCDVCHTLLVKSSAPYFSKAPPKS